MAAAIASTSPGGTSRPFSPSSTTSGIPPTLVAITGVPAASASSSVCGRFSHADVTSAASAARKSAIDVVARARPEEAHALRDAEGCSTSLEPCRAPGRRRGRAADTSGTRASAASALAERLLRREATGRAEHPPVDPERRTRLVPRRAVAGPRGAGFGTRPTPVGSSPQPSAIARR